MTLINYLYQPKAFKRLIGAYYSYLRGSYYSGGRTNRGGSSNRGITVCCPNVPFAVGVYSIIMLFSDILGMLNQKIWVPNLGIFVIISVLLMDHGTAILRPFVECVPSFSTTNENFVRLIGRGHSKAITVHCFIKSLALLIDYLSR